MSYTCYKFRSTCNEFEKSLYSLVLIAGKFADIVAIEGDPLPNIEAMLNVRFVMKNGTVYKNE